MLATFAESKASSALNDIAGKCPGSYAFRDLLNEATSRLMNRGDWEGTICPIYVCVYGGCVVFPRYVGQVRTINVCNRTATVKNNWSDFNLFGNDWRNTWGSWRGDRLFDWRRGASSGGMMIGSTQTPVFQDVQGEGRLIRAYPRVNADLGKTLTVFGVDNNGQTLMRQDEIGNWVEGKVITFTKPFGSTDVYVRRIDRVLKDKTQGPIDVYAYNATTDLLEDIAHYEPSETNPSYSRYQLHAGCSNSLKSVVALVKLRFVPVFDDTDLVLIENLNALADFMQSLRYKKAGDTKSANEYEASAIRELNLQLWNRDGESAVTVQNAPFGGIYTGPRVF